MVTLISCNCLPQIPIQTLYADENCQATLPNYLIYFDVFDNCGGAIPTQNPPAGYILDAGSPYVEVTIEAVDISGNINTRRFDVVLLDTMPPEIRVDSSFFTLTWQQNKAILMTYQHNIENHMRRYYRQYWDSIKYDHNLVTWQSLNHTYAAGYYPNTDIWFPVDSAARAKLGIELYTLKLEVE